MDLRKLNFMAAKFKSDLAALNTPVPLSGEYTNKQLGKYYIDFPPNPLRLNRLISSLDKDGIPLNTTYIDVKEEKLHYYPISIGQFGLAIFHEYLKSGSTQKKDHFKDIARWFFQSAETDPRLGTFWLTEVPKPEYNISQPWKSAFSQSRGISILLREFQLTGREDYYEKSTLALQPFLFDISKGGVTDKKTSFYEEYVADKPTRVLDGHCFSLFGLHDMVRAAEDDSNRSLAKDLFNAGIDSLQYWLPRFDTGDWVRFNYPETDGYPEYDPCTIGYVKLVSAQLHILHAITKKEFLKSYSEKFKSYLKPLNILKMYYYKSRALKTLNRL